MATATVICGTADPVGTTRAMCDQAQRILESKGWKVLSFNPADMDIAHCRDCDSCTDGRCIIHDDMDSIYEAFSSSDLLILSTPMHFSGPSSVIKTVMDRFQPYWNKSLGHPRQCALMMCGGSKEPNFDLTERIVKAFCITTGMEYKGSLRIPDTDSGVHHLEDEVLDFMSSILLE